MRSGGSILLSESGSKFLAIDTPFRDLFLFCCISESRGEIMLITDKNEIQVKEKIIEKVDNFAHDLLKCK
jgi:hypothetical protein